MAGMKTRDVVEYLYRSYTVVDGLWFMKIEEESGFERALEIDTKVWEIVPKIQSRFLRSKTGNPEGIAGLLICFKIKLRLDGFEFKTRNNIKNHNIEFNISRCPWHEILVKSKRTGIAEKIGSRICRTEYGVWAKEFGNNIEFELLGQLCNGGKSCRLFFNSR